MILHGDHDNMEKEIFYLVLWTTGKCNLNCRYCYACNDSHRNDMSFDTAKRAIDMFENKPVKLQFAGGEPLINFDLICRVYQYVRQKGIDAVLQLQTNATLIDAEIAVMIKKMRLATGVSFDGPPAVNETLRGGTKLAVDGLAHLARAGVTVNLNSVVSAQNVERLPEVIDFAHYMGNVAGIGLDLLRLTGRASKPGSNLHLPQPEQLRTLLYRLHEKSLRLSQTTGVKVAVREIEEAKKRLSNPGMNGHYCYASCGRSYVVLPDGAVYPCGSLWDRKEYFMGNVISGELFSVSLGKQKENAFCRDCRYRRYCPGGCPSRLLINEWETADTSLDCVLKKAAFEIAEAELCQKNTWKVK
jgi:uncharacterized protein